MTKAECNYDVHVKELWAIVKNSRKQEKISQQHKTSNHHINGPPILSTVYVNQKTDRKANPMDGSTKSIQH